MKLLPAPFAGLFPTLLLLHGANGATEAVVYSFCSQYSEEQCLDGDLPNAGMIDVKGILYGTTVYGGAQGYGTVFSSSRQAARRRCSIPFAAGKIARTARRPTPA